MTDEEAWESLKQAHRHHRELIVRDRIRAENPLLAQAMDRRNRYVPCQVVETATPPGHERGHQKPKDREYREEERWWQTPS